MLSDHSSYAGVVHVGENSCNLSVCCKISVIQKLLHIIYLDMFVIVFCSDESLG
jgi:hypothetical protein